MEGAQLKPIEKEKTTQDKVYKEIKKAILYGGITSDEIFTEVQLAEKLNTSRTPGKSCSSRLDKGRLTCFCSKKRNDCEKTNRG
ncbi:hypothetical protein AB1J28_22625 [Lysinibacillus irui]|uniref:hypothetical protein n=1 Tax=Lysinibacillus irui TaxID=2998077 RepID=UPI003D2A7DD0